MTPDWNWFFSSLSQSAAAIVGIFGAFIITKIFSNQTTFLDKNTKIKQLLIQAKKISDNANNYKISWYNKHYNHPEFRSFHVFLDNHFPSEEDISTITDEILDNFIKSSKFSVYSSTDEIKKELTYIADKMFQSNAKSRERDEAARKLEAEYKNTLLSGIIGYPQLMGGMSNISDMLNPQYKPLFTTYGEVHDTPWPDVHKEAEELEKSYLEAKHHARLVADLLEATEENPESPTQISAALLLVLFIFFIGVIYPLSFMPATGGPEISASIDVIKSHIASFKGLLLGVISTAFTVIIAIFYRTNSAMKYNPEDLKKIRELTDAKNYCRYFKFIEDSEPT